MSEDRAGEADTLHTGREVAAQLGLGDAMARRYAQTYEEVSGETILTHRRDGRLFTDDQLSTLLKARAIVQQTNVDVASAIRQALEQPVSLAEITLPQGSALSIERLSEAITAAQKEANAPLLEALQSIDGKLSQLVDAGQVTKLATSQGTNDFRPDESKSSPDENVSQGTQHGLLVRLALRLERILKR